MGLLPQGHAIHQRNDACLDAAWQVFGQQARGEPRALSPAEVAAIRRGGSKRFALWALRTLVITMICIAVVMGLALGLAAAVADRRGDELDLVQKAIPVFAVSLAVALVVVALHARGTQLAPRRQGASILASMAGREVAVPAVVSGFEVNLGRGGIQNGLLVLSSAAENLPLRARRGDWPIPKRYVNRPCWGWTVGEVGPGKTFAVIFDDGTVTIPKPAEAYEPVARHGERNAARLASAAQLWQSPPRDAPRERPITPAEVQVIERGGHAKSQWRGLFIFGAAAASYLALAVLALGWLVGWEISAQALLVLGACAAMLILGVGAWVIQRGVSAGKRLLASLGARRVAEPAVIALQELVPAPFQPSQVIDTIWRMHDAISARNSQKTLTKGGRDLADAAALISMRNSRIAGRRWVNPWRGPGPSAGHHAGRVMAQFARAWPIPTVARRLVAAGSTPLVIVWPIVFGPGDLRQDASRSSPHRPRAGPARSTHVARCGRGGARRSRPHARESRRLGTDARRVRAVFGGAGGRVGRAGSAVLPHQGSQPGSAARSHARWVARPDELVGLWPSQPRHPHV